VWVEELSTITCTSRLRGTLALTIFKNARNSRLRCRRWHSVTKIRVAKASFVGSADVLAGAAYGMWSRKIRLTLLMLMP
jgi:hypothetical protein